MVGVEDPLRHLGAWSRGLPEGVALTAIHPLVLVQRLYYALHTAKGSLDLIVPPHPAATIAEVVLNQLRDLAQGVRGLGPQSCEQLQKCLVPHALKQNHLQLLKDLAALKLVDTQSSLTPVAVPPVLVAVPPVIEAWLGTHKIDAASRTRLQTALREKFLFQTTSAVIALSELGHFDAEVEQPFLASGGFLVTKIVTMKKQDPDAKTMSALTVEVRALCAAPIAVEYLPAGFQRIN